MDSSTRLCSPDPRRSPRFCWIRSRSKPHLGCRRSPASHRLEAGMFIRRWISIPSNDLSPDLPDPRPVDPIAIIGVRSNLPLLEPPWIQPSTPSCSCCSLFDSSPRWPYVEPPPSFKGWEGLGPSDPSWAWLGPGRLDWMVVGRTFAVGVWLDWTSVGGGIRRK